MTAIQKKLKRKQPYETHDQYLDRARQEFYTQGLRDTQPTIQKGYAWWTTQDHTTEQDQKTQKKTPLPRQPEETHEAFQARARQEFYVQGIRDSKPQIRKGKVWW